MVKSLCVAITLTFYCQPAIGQTQEKLLEQSSGAIAEWVLGEVTPASAEAIEWLTDIQQGYDQSKSKDLPLVILMIQENESGLSPECGKLEEGTLVTREFNLFRKSAVFVRINVAATDLSASTQDFVTTINTEEVPLLVFMEGDNLSFGAIAGDKPTADYIREVRRKLIMINLAKRSRDKSTCTDAEFMRGVETFMIDADALKSKEDDALAKREKILNDLRDEGRFQIAAFREAENRLDEIQSQLRDKLLALAELNSPVIKEFCASQLEIASIFRDSDNLLKRDLLGVTANGRLASGVAIDMAKKMLEQSRNELKAEEDAVDERVGSSGKALDDRFNHILQNDEPQADKSE